MIALGEQQQPPRGLELERRAARRPKIIERADHHSARRGQPLLGRPQGLLALARAHDNQPARVEPELHQSRRIRRALLGEHALLARPDDPRGASPAQGQPERKAKRRRLVPRPRRADFMQGRSRHLGGDGLEIRGGWTRSHVHCMF